MLGLKSKVNKLTAFNEKTMPLPVFPSNYKNATFTFSVQVFSFYWTTEVALSHFIHILNSNETWGVLSKSLYRTYLSTFLISCLKLALTSGSAHSKFSFQSCSSCSSRVSWDIIGRVAGSYSGAFKPFSEITPLSFSFKTFKKNGLYKMKMW